MAKGKPFIKWVGGKSQLISQLEKLLPKGFNEKKNLTYVEPFIGGGAMLFYMLQNYGNIEHAVINDINPDLTGCYKTVRDTPYELIEALENIQKEYYALENEESRKEYFLCMRERFNNKAADPLENTALFLFLNRTCFNGLYRVNKSGKFNVPFGRYLRPQICDKETILVDSQLLQRVEILTGDFENTLNYTKSDAFFYFDPPYRPISKTSYFKDYARESFSDTEQIRLKQFCDKISDSGHLFMLSNSDSSLETSEDSFFDELFAQYEISRVWASRNINSVGSKRGKLTEILVRNYLTQQEKLEPDL